MSHCKQLSKWCCVGPVLVSSLPILHTLIHMHIYAYICVYVYVYQGCHLSRFSCQFHYRDGYGDILMWEWWRFHEFRLETDTVYGQNCATERRLR